MIPMTNNSVSEYTEEFFNNISKEDELKLLHKFYDKIKTENNYTDEQTIAYIKGMIDSIVVLNCSDNTA